MANERILIIEDERLLRMSLAAELGIHGFKIEEADTAKAGVARFSRGDIDLVLLDYRLPDGDGISVLRQVKKVSPETPVILMTAYASLDTAVEAIKLGAYDYVHKPFEFDELLIRIRKAIETTGLRKDVRRFTRTQKRQHGLSNLVGASPAMRALRAQIERIIESAGATVLLRGESGTGKDVLARAIHYESERVRAPFVNVTCTAIPDHLLESELFGHEKRAFTDARSQKKGLLEKADGGTVFLDEIGDMSVALQAKLLRFLEDRRFRRVGGTNDIQVDVRVVAATNRNLEEAVRDGSFRQDLYYRLKVIEIYTPPLRVRKGDVRLLAATFARALAKELRRPFDGIRMDAVHALERYPWPGNVRELKNAIERAMILGRDGKIGLADLPPEVTGGTAYAHPAPLPPTLLGSGTVWTQEASSATIAAQPAGLRFAAPRSVTAAALPPQIASAEHVFGAPPPHGVEPATYEPSNCESATYEPATYAPPTSQPATAPGADERTPPSPNPGPEARGWLYLKLPEEGIRWQDLEDDLVQQALDRTRGNQSAAARLLGLSRDQLRYRMERIGLLPPSKRRQQRVAQRKKRSQAKPAVDG